MDPRAILATKLNGGELSDAQVRAFMSAYVDGDVPEYQASALLAAIYLQGMTPPELACWARAMLESGRVLDLGGIDGPKVDKHSTGGVGDKVSIPLAPAVAVCGVRVPMISGRGLGHTAGTLDKLEAVPGLTTELDEDEFRAGVAECGLAFGAQTEDVVPADRKLYALRDATGLVDSIPLVASSIMSKKLAEGIDGLVLDVKFGSGAFFPDPETGAQLAQSMSSLAAEMGVPARAFQTSMHQPLGRAVGHALEIAESLDCLRGEGPADLRELVGLFGGEMLLLAGLVADRGEGRRRIEAALDDGSALERFRRVVERQHGDPRSVDDPALLPTAPDVATFEAEEAGVLDFESTRDVGLACAVLGGGRRHLGDEIDPAVGVVWLRKAGEAVERGEPLCEIHHRGGHGLDEARAHLQRAVRIVASCTPPPLVLAGPEGGGA